MPAKPPSDPPPLADLVIGPEAREAATRAGLELRVELRPGEGVDGAEAERSLRDELAAARARLDELQKLGAIGQLGAGITHEVRNVMTGILGFAQVARRRLEDGGVDPQGGPELLLSIERESLRCLEILGNFLDVARPTAREVGEIDLGELVRAVGRLAGHQLNLRGVRLEVEPAEAVPRVAGRTGELKQVLLNLVLNAMQAMQPEGGQVKISTARAEDGAALVRVADSGPGMDLPVQRRIFDPFFTTKPRGEGTGLGLFISRKIVEDHGGTLTVESAPGQGAMFTIRLPAGGG